MQRAVVEINWDGAQGSTVSRLELVLKPLAVPDINPLVTGLQGGLVGEKLAAWLSPKPVIQLSISLMFNKWTQLFLITEV